jgi:ABC-2 type transport system permease protein
VIAVLACEFAKLKRSLVLLLCAAAPTFVSILAFVMLLDRKKPEAWGELLIGGSGLWAFFMLPMTVTALTVLVAQIEHGPRAWNHILTLPVPRWRFFAAKAAVVMTLTAAMSVVLFVQLPLAGLLAQAVKPGCLAGSVPLREFAEVLVRMYLGSVLMVALQLWASLHFRSFVPPLVLGIGGTFVAVVATGARQGAYFPWLIPVNALASDVARANLALGVGLWGGVAVGVLMLAFLSRRQPA